MQTFLVGGAVRDALLNRKVTERDYVVVGATLEDMLAKGFTQVGSDFPVFLHPKTGEEYALARTERKSGSGYKGFICDASRTVTLEEDLLRRDLTVNAMAQSDDGTIIDPYNGQADLQQRILRHVSSAFDEDPLRVFRVARFAARYAYLGFTIAPETKLLMAQMAKSGELKTLSAERVWQETKRSLLEQTPEVFFTVLDKVNGLHYWFKEVSDDIERGIETLIASVSIQNAQTGKADEQTTLILRFTALLSHWNEHDARELCKRLKVPNYVSDIVILTCKFKALLLGKDTPINNHQTNERVAEDLLTLFNGCDAWRRNDRFSLLLSAFAPYAIICGVNWEYRSQQIQEALAIANQVNVKEIVAKGIKGTEIKKALHNERKKAIQMRAN